MREDKEAIIKALELAAKQTIAGSGIESMTYHVDTDEDERPRPHYDEYVRIIYEDGTMVVVNVSLDSGAAMIRDVLENGLHWV